MNALLRQMLTQTVAISPYVGLDAYGKPTYGVPVVRATRIEHKVQLQPTPQGYARVQQTRLFFDGDVPIDTRDRIQLPDGTAPAIAILYEVPDLSGVVHHYQAYL